MFDVGFFELVLLFVIGLLILGPERLPRVATQIGRWVGRARRTATQLRHQIEREVALNDLRKPPSYRPPPSPDQSSDSSPSDESSDSPSSVPGDSAAASDDSTVPDAPGAAASASESPPAADGDSATEHKYSTDT